MMDVLRRAVMATNRFGAGELDELRIRIGLISYRPHPGRPLGRPLCRVVRGGRRASWPARIGGRPSDLAPQTVARAALGAAMAAFACWARHDADDLIGEVDRAFRLLATGFDEARLAR